LNDEALISLLNTMEEGAHGWVLKVEVSKLLVHLTVRYVSDDGILLDAMNVEVDRFHSVTSCNLHDFENLTETDVN